MLKQANNLILFFLILCASGCEVERISSQEAPASSLNESWTFERTFNHSVIDPSPLAEYRINDIQIGDIDLDGRPDIWVSGRGGGEKTYQMAWYRNPDWRRFNVARGDYKYGNMADLDKDGDLDIIVGKNWFENTGDYLNADWPEYSLGYSEEPDLVHVADINGDGFQDIVFTTKNGLWIMKNNGKPKENWEKFLVFKEKGKRTGGDIGDIDSDGDMDILWGNAWFENPAGDKSSNWKKNIIDSSWPAEARGQIGDIDLDGLVDIVLSDEEGNKGISLFLSKQNGGIMSWNKKEISTEYSGVHSLQIADFNKDGKPDIFAAEMHHGTDPDKIAVFENIDISKNKWREHIIGDFGSHNAKAGDLDGDGYPEIVGKNYQGGSLPLRVDIWENSESSSFMPVDRWVRYIIDEERPWRAVFIDCKDLDGDRLPDVITGGWWYKNPGTANKKWTRIEIGEDMKNIAILEDFDLDGDMDILGTTGITNNNDLILVENDGSGKFILIDKITNNNGDFLQGADAGQIIPGDEIEFVLSWHNKIDTQLLKKSSDSDDNWEINKLSEVTNGEQIEIGDVDLDGDLDVHLGTVWLKNENNSWEPVKAFNISVRNADPDRVKLADINEDGLPDAVIGCEHAKCVLWAENKMKSSNEWKEHIISEDFQAMSLDVGDIDKDGDVDIVAGEHNNKDPHRGRVVIYQNMDKGARWQGTVVDSGMEHHDGTQFCDIDNDSDLDIVSIGWLHSNVVVYENRATN